MVAKRSLLNEVKAIIPPLLPEFHKGQAGRVGVIGGSREYTGAPYYASMSSMRLGCDMTFTICEPVAAATIKTYSPDLIVNPLLDENRPVSEVRSVLQSLFGRMHSLVIGPGLGRDEHMQKFARVAIEAAREANLYLVIDADGLWLVQNAPETVRGYSRVVLTPNVVEFGRLCDQLQVDRRDPEQAAQRLCDALGGPTIVEKGSVDRIVSPAGAVVCDVEGGLKRCGGQGDLLSGMLGTFLAWAKRYEERMASGSGPVLAVDKQEAPQIPTERLPLLAAYGAATVTRTTSNLGFRRLGRSMLANDLMDDIGQAYEKVFGLASHV